MYKKIKPIFCIPNGYAKKILMIMKLTTLVIIVLALHVSAATLAQKVTFNKKNATLDQLFTEIQKQTGYNVLWSERKVSKIHAMDLSFNDALLNDVLDKALEGLPLTYEIQDKTVLIKEKTITTSANPIIKVEGTVNDSKGQPLPGVSILVKGSTRGTSTDASGKFSISVKQGDVLVFTFIGFNQKEVTIEKNTTINIVMQEAVSQLNQIVVIGYGTAKKNDLTGSISSITQEDIKQVKSQTIDNALVGKLPGVYVQNKGGAPGAGAFVYIRGLSQVRGDNQPLYVIDGTPIVITPNSESLGLINYGSRENPLLAINPDDVERVDVLKDASATAIYGSRAANGVIMVTTRRGKRNQAPKFSFNFSSTIQNPVKTNEYLSASEYKQFATKTAQLALSQYPEAYWPIYFPDEYQIVTNPDTYFGTANTNWQDLITNKNALWNQYNFNLNGGSENVNYMLSAGISDQEGVMIENDFKRYTYNGNLDANITKGFKVGGSLSYSYSVNNSKGFSSLGLGNFRPDVSPYKEDGSYSTYVGPFGEQYTLLGDGMQTQSESPSKNLVGSIYGEIGIIDGLKFKSQLNIGLSSDQTTRFNTSKSSDALFYGLYYDQAGARLDVQRNEGKTTAFENTLSYQKIFSENHRIDAVAGISWNHSRYDAEAQHYRGFPDDETLTDLSSANFIDGVESESIEQGLNSLFGRVNYAFKEKYLATFTARRDGSTKFGPDNRYGFFPSGALAWNMHKENFMKELKFIDQLKLRASLGRVGSDNLPSFTYLAYYQSLENDESYYNGINGIAVTGVPNSKIRWEETDQLDLGLDFSLFNNRVTGEVVYFEKHTSGIILFTPLPFETGATRWNANVADLSNRGWEFLIGFDVIRNKNFRWNSSFNFSRIRNNVDNLYGASAGSQTVIEGKPLGVITGYDVVKIAQTQDEIDALNTQAGGRYQISLTQPGDYIYKDINGDGKITSSDRGPIGDINPDFFGGWNNTATYKNWDFSLNWNFSSGAQREFTPITNMYYPNALENPNPVVRDTWSVDNKDAKYAAYGSASHGYTTTSKSIVDASYIKLRSASVGYILPPNLFKKVGVSQTKITLSGNNLWTITNYPGLDPEDVDNQSFANRTTGFTRDGGRNYPNVRSFTFSLNVTF